MGTSLVTDLGSEAFSHPLGISPIQCFGHYWMNPKYAGIRWGVRQHMPQPSTWSASLQLDRFGCEYFRFPNRGEYS